MQSLVLTAGDASFQQFSLPVLIFPIFKNLYAMSELAQELIKSRAHAHSWSIQSYPGKIKLPSDILKPFPNAEAANKVMVAVYGLLMSFDSTFPFMTRSLKPL